MRIRKHLPTLFALTAVLTLGVALYTNVNKAHSETEAAQVTENFAPYTYSGSYYSDHNIDFNAGDGMNGNLRKKLSEEIVPKGFVDYSSGLSTHLQQADEDQNNTNNMVLFYTRDSVKKHGATDWNREHVWPKSLSNGNWGTSKGGTDIRHLRPTYNKPNSDRSSHPFGNCNGVGKMVYEGMHFGYLNGNIFEPLDCVKGDVARIIMYIWTTYNTYPGYSSLNITKVFESYDTLLSWHTMDKPDTLEGHRNDYVQNETLQKNRNPFVDHPELAWKIFGDQASDSVTSACMAAYPYNGGTPIDPTGITLNKSTVSVEVGKSTQLTASLLPSGASGTITWSSDNNAIATVSNGKVTGVSTGSTIIKAICGSYSDSCTVTVTEPVPTNYGTLDNPISVAEVRDILDNESPTSQEIYVKGIVSSSTYNTKYSNFDNVYLKDGDNDEGMSLYHSVLDDGVDTKYNVSGALVGKEVIACGYGELYKGSKYELSKQNDYTPTIISVNDPQPIEKTPKEIVEAKTTSTSLAYRYNKTTAGESSITDTLTKSDTAATTTSYVEWTHNKTASGASYAGLSAANNGAIQLKSKDNISGIVTTSNPNEKKASVITVSWATSTENNRTLNIYGKNTAYSAPSDLYSESDQGTLLGKIVKGTSTSLTITGDYKFIGVRSNSGAIWLDSLNIQWGGATATYEYSDTCIRFGAVIEKTLWSDLDTDNHLIEGFGVVIANGELVNNNEDFIDAVDTAELSTVTTDLSQEVAIDYFVPISNMNIMGDDGKGNYFWNLRQSVTDYEKEYAAAAYIKVDGECIYLKYAKYSLKTLAKDYLDNRNYDETSYDGSLSNLAK